MPPRDKESYMHYYAKIILEEWLVSAWNYNKKNGYDNKLYILEWKIDCSISNCGIRLEYPILSKLMADGSKTLLGVSHAWKNYPDLEKLADNVKVEAILDVAIIEDGSLKYGIEVVYKHICSKKKRDFLTLYQDQFKVYEISAEWVLGQLRDKIPPKKLPLVSV
jgi:hypothetical protein